ncbi:PDDEXK family nuclease [Burkholderia gladioli]|uniref:hypothetical protein n=1 Tax=Burkholderia gladioli TaxID=28095 RepID=UPI0034DB76E3
MLEKTVEAYLVERVRALGGTAYKFTSPARASVPDRIVILPPGRIYFVELKRPGGKLTRGQERKHEHLRRLGADVRMLDSIGAINAFLNEVQAVAADETTAPVPMGAISRILDEVMQRASENGADSRSMPDDYVAVAHFTCYPEKYRCGTSAESKCTRCGSSTAQACNELGCFYLESGEGEPATADERAAQDEPSEIEQVIACLGDDAAKLREANPDDEMADNMEAAARLLSEQGDIVERCARIADSYKCGSCGLDGWIGAAIRASQPVAPASIGPVSTWPGYKRGFNDGRKAAAPAEAREPIGSVRVNIVRLTREVSEPVLTLSREFEALLDASPGVDFPLYSVPADAGEAVASELTDAMIDAARPLFLALECGATSIDAVRHQMRQGGVNVDLLPKWFSRDSGHLTKAGRAIIAWHLMKGAQGGKGGDRG